MKDEDTSRQFYAVRFEDDIPKSGKGMFIPNSIKNRRALPPSRIVVPYKQYRALLVLPVVAGVFLALLSLVGLSQVPSRTVSLPASLSTATSAAEPTLKYGVQVALTRPAVFAETRDALIEAEETFVEVDLTNESVRFFDEGVLAISTPILAKGEVGSWWQTPAGLYQVEAKKDNYYSTVGQMYQPWTLVFQGNLVIHGWPTTEAGEVVGEDFTSGGVRIATEAAERLFAAVPVGTTVLVHDTAVTSDSFLYEPKVPELKTPHYLIADVKSSTVLASSDLDAVASIASVAKLMTALVAAEHINLDSTVSVSEPTFVQSLIPRLGERSRVSMYSLLQLLLVESSNEAAEVIAAQLGREEFVALMNAKAKSLGMLKTNFADASGLSAENTSSLSDLLRLTEYIYTNRSFIFELTANSELKTAHIGGQFGELTNFNEVEDLDNFIGGKVGETIAAGQTSVTLHELEVKGETRVVAIIILGSVSRNEDVRELLRYAEERFGE